MTLQHWTGPWPKMTWPAHDTGAPLACTRTGHRTLDACSGAAVSGGLAAVRSSPREGGRRRGGARQDQRDDGSPWRSVGGEAGEEEVEGLTRGCHPNLNNFKLF
jgi:hypothetical protein